MANLCSYFVNDSKKLIPINKYMVKGEKYRFTILTPRLIRIEYNSNGHFEDRATSLVVNRTFADCNFTVDDNNIFLMIKTEYFTLTYVKERPISGNNIKVNVNGTDKVWEPGNKEVRNVGSITYSLDDLGDTLKLGKGLYSLDGFVLVDDSKSFVIDNEIFIPREETTDLYLFVYRSDLGLCLQDYFNLTGYPPMIPRYALGPWWYKNDTYNMYDIDNILKKFSDNEIPISAFILGDKWHNNVENYNYDRNLFDVASLYKYYGSKLQKFGVTVDPSLPVTVNDPLFNEVTKFIQPDRNNQVSFIPLDNNTISAYLNVIVNNIMNSGIKIFNIDYNNPKDRAGLFLLNHYHYVVANLKERGVILSRNPGIAPHRYPIIYSGKTKVSWDTIKALAVYNNSAANLGVCWQAHAIGGWSGGIENSELFLRYIQFGVFSPIFLLAGETGKYYKREPWRWNTNVLNIIREYMQLRNKLVPYIYNESYTYHKYGVPLIQPLYYKYPKIYDEPNYVNQYFFGSKIMISPIVKKRNYEMNRVVQRVFIPNGVWYDYSTGKKYMGNKYYVGFYKNEDYPIFIKEGSIIPMSLDMNTELAANMEIQIYPAENGLYGSYELYEDDGYSVKVGRNYMITKMNLDKTNTGYVFTMKRKDGNLNIPNRNYTLRFRNMKSPSKVLVKRNNQVSEVNFETNKNDLIIKITDVNCFEPLEVSILGTNIEIETISVINEEIAGILDDLEINTTLKEEIDTVIFSNLPMNKKRIELRKLKKKGLVPKFITMFIDLLKFIETK